MTFFSLKTLLFTLLSFPLGGFVSSNNFGLVITQQELAHG